MPTRSVWPRLGLVSLATLAALAAAGGLLSAFAAGPLASPPLSASAAVAGRVTDAQTGLPISGLAVSAYDAVSSLALANQLTNDQGDYTLPVTSAYGSVKLKYDYGAPYGLDWYAGAVDFSHATAISIANGTTVSNLDVALARGSYLSATVNVGGVAPPAGGHLEAQLYEPDGDFIALSTVNSGQVLFFAKPGSYRLRLVGNLGTSGWYTAAPSFASAAPITLSAGLTTTLNIDLAPGGVITGRITDASSGLPVPNASVAIFDALGQYLVFPSSYAIVDPNGVYTASGLAAGSYRVSFRAWDHQLQDYGAPVSVTAGAAVRGSVDASLMPLAMITGQLTRSGGQPLGAFDRVQLRAYFESSNVEAGRNDTFGPLPGGYQLPVQPGRVQIHASGSGLAPEWYDDQTIQPVARPLSLSAGQTLPNINIDLAPGTGCIIGAVTGPGGALSGVPVQVFDADGQPQPAVGTFADGGYQACGLANGLYRVLYGQYPYPLQWNGGQSEQSLANPIPVLNGLSTTVNMALDGVGGCVTGRLVGADGLAEPATYRRIILLNALGDRQWFYNEGAQPVDTLITFVDGRFAVCGLPDGAYSVIGYEDGNFDDRFEPGELSGRRLVTVSAGQATPVDILLLPARMHLPLIER